MGTPDQLVGTPDQIVERVQDYADVELDLVHFQCGPTLEEGQRLSREFILRLEPTPAQREAGQGPLTYQSFSFRWRTSTPRRSCSSLIRPRLTLILVPFCRRTA